MRKIERPWVLCNVLFRSVRRFGQGCVASDSGFQIAVGFSGIEQPLRGKGFPDMWLIPIRTVFWLSMHSANIPEVPVRNPELY